MTNHTTSAKDGVKLQPAVQKTPQGIGLPDNWRNNRPTSGFSYGAHENATHSPFLTDCAGTSKGVPFPIDGSPTPHRLPPVMDDGQAGSQPVNRRPTMPNSKKGNTAQITPISSGKTTTTLNQYQRAIECIDRAKFLLNEGKPQIAIGQLMVATRSLKQAVGGAA